MKFSPLFALLLLFACERVPATDEQTANGGPVAGSMAIGSGAQSVPGPGGAMQPGASDPQPASGPSAGASENAGSDGTAGSDEAAAGAAGSAQHPTGGSAGSDPTQALPPADLEHTFPTITLAAGQEQTDLCQSWTLDNDEALYVNRVVTSNEGGWHHSNWIWVDAASYDGPDGTWPCADRGFEQILAGAVGGVFFAQSTQSQHDIQAFPSGAAFELPPHVRIIGDVHLLNVRDSEMQTSLHFDIYTLPATDVRVKLQPMAFTNTALDIAAAGDSSARMQCATPQPDFDIYYVLPHYHVNGLRMRLDVVGGALDGSNVFTSHGSYGEPLGQIFDPPLAVTGAEALAISCDYHNASDQVLGYGVGNQEMCVVLIYSTGAKAGGTALTNVSVEDSGGIHRTDALCVSVGAP